MKIIRKGLFLSLSLMMMGCQVHHSEHVYYLNKMTYSSTEEGMTSDDDLRQYEVDITYDQKYHVINEHSKQDIEQYYLSYTNMESVSQYLLDFDLSEADLHVLLDRDVIVKYPIIEKDIANKKYSYHYDIMNNEIVKASGIDQLGSFTHHYFYDKKGYLTRIERTYENGSADSILLTWDNDHLVNIKDDEDVVNYTYKDNKLTHSSNDVTYHYKDNKLVSFDQEDYQVKYTYKTSSMKQEVFNDKNLMETYHYQYKKIK